jgi:hypothetical protein
MIFYKAPAKVELPIDCAYYTLVGKLLPGKQALLRDVTGNLAKKDKSYSSKINLSTNYTVVDETLKSGLIRATGENAAVLVGDLKPGKANTKPEGMIVQEIVEHMRHRKQILEQLTKTKRAKSGLNGRYVTLLKQPNLFHRSKKGNQRSYSCDSVNLILAVDGTNPSVFRNDRTSMGHAILSAEELFFQTKYFFRSDEVRVLIYGDSVRDITSTWKNPSSWKIKANNRNTVSCLETCLNLADHNKRHTHIYHMATGGAHDPKIIDMTKKIKDNKISFTQFCVDASGKDLGAMLQTAQDAGGDVYPILKENVNLLSLMLGEHFETYRK